MNPPREKPYRLTLHHPDAQDALVLDGYAVLALVEVEPNAWTVSVRGGTESGLGMMLATLIEKMYELNPGIVDRAIAHLDAGSVPLTAFTRRYNKD